MTVRGWLGSLVALSIALLPAGCEVVQRPAAGPLLGEGTYISYYPLPPVGRKFSEGFLQMEVAGSEVATIEAVSVQGGNEAMEFLGARLGLPGRPDDFNQFMKGYPPRAVPKRFQVPAVGAVLEPGKVYMLIVGYRVRAHVLDLRTGIRVDYRVGRRRYTRHYQAGIAACPPPLTDDRCDRVSGWGLDDVGAPGDG